MIPVLNDTTPIGTTPDMARRLRAVLPTGWFPTSPPQPAASATPVLDGLLSGLGAAWSFCFGLLSTAVVQTRISTGSGPFLDMMAADFFGSSVTRKAGESDTSFRSRISSSLLSRRGTREDVIRAVTGVADAAPFICEPSHAADCGGYGSATDVGIGGALGYGVFGLRYGSSQLPFQFLLNAVTYAAFAPNVLCTRQSPATFVNQFGLIQTASTFELRPLFQGGQAVGPLLEPRGFNLITDSQNWSMFSQPATPGGSTAVWSVSSAPGGVLASDSVMIVTSVAGVRVEGPSVDVAASGAMIVASAWFFLPKGSSFTAVELVVSDLNTSASAVYAKANMSLVGQWQRLSASVQPTAAAGKNLRIGLALSSTGASGASLSTQCWQAEPGTAATSYIPTAGSLGIRARDDVISSVSAQTPQTFAPSDVCNAVASTIPAATIAWTSVAIPS